MKNTNSSKGFSLVELIVVIAIMAILVGILAPNLMKQVEKSRLSKDKSTLESIATAFSTAWADVDAQEACSIVPSTGQVLTLPSAATAGSPAWQKEVLDNLKMSSVNDFGSQKFGSKDYKNMTWNDVNVEITDSQVIKVSLANSSGKSIVISK